MQLYKGADGTDKVRLGSKFRGQAGLERGGQGGIVQTRKIRRKRETE